MDFTFRDRWRETLTDLPWQVRREVEEAVIRYGLTRELIPLKAKAKVAFEILRRDIDAEAKEKEMKEEEERKRLIRRREATRERMRRLRERQGVTQDVTPRDASRSVTEKETERVKESAPFGNPLKEKPKEKEKDPTTTTPVREASDLDWIDLGELSQASRARHAASEIRAGGIDRRIEASAKALVDENTACLHEFFAHTAQIESLCIQLKVDMEALRAMAEEVVNEWLLTGERHVDYNDWARHMISVLRFKASSKAKAEALAKARIDGNSRLTAEERNRQYYDRLGKEININRPETTTTR